MILFITNDILATQKEAYLKCKFNLQIKYFSLCGKISVLEFYKMKRPIYILISDEHNRNITS